MRMSAGGSKHLRKCKVLHTLEGTSGFEGNIDFAEDRRIARTWFHAHDSVLAADSSHLVGAKDDVRR